jgi:hypothetical protein
LGPQNPASTPGLETAAAESPLKGTGNLRSLSLPGNRTIRTPFEAAYRWREWVVTMPEERSHKVMSTTVTGIVTNGVVVPSTPLPEGACVEIQLSDAVPAFPPELQEEMAAWEQGSAEALALVERLAEEEEANEKKRR